MTMTYSNEGGNAYTITAATHWRYWPVVVHASGFGWNEINYESN
jgi:hypothetical protein